MLALDPTMQALLSSFYDWGGAAPDRLWFPPATALVSGGPGAQTPSSLTPSIGFVFQSPQHRWETAVRPLLSRCLETHLPETRCGIRVECRSSQGYAHGNRCIKVGAKPQLSEHLSPNHVGRTPAPRTLCSYHTGNTVTQRSLQQLLPTNQIFICNPKFWILTFSMQQTWPTSFFFNEIMYGCIDLIPSLPQVLKEHAFVLLSWLQNLTLDHDFEGVFTTL